MHIFELVLPPIERFQKGFSHGGLHCDENYPGRFVMIGQTISDICPDLRYVTSSFCIHSIPSWYDSGTCVELSCMFCDDWPQWLQIFNGST